MTSRNPAATSPHRPAWALGAATGATRTCVNSAAATANVSASKASAQPLPTQTTSRPATPLPTIIATFWAIRRQEIARWRSSAGTVCWVIADELGLPRALRQPLSMPRTASSGMLDQPPISDSATSPWATAAAAAEPWSMTVRGSRSPRTPPNSTAPTSASA